MQTYAYIAIHAIPVCAETENSQLDREVAQITYLHLSPQGISGATIAQGQTSTGKVYVVRLRGHDNDADGLLHAREDGG